MAVSDHALSLSAQGGDYLHKGEWLGTVTYRYLHADRLFVGSQEIAPVEAFENREIHFIDVHAAYMVTKRLSLELTFPFKHAESTSKYEHDFKNNHTMSAGGLGDIRLVGHAWLLDPEKQREKERSHQNIGLGLGVQFPTGDYKATDISYRETGPIYRPVHPALQPGTGGWGVVLELEAFREIFKNTFAYVAGSYLISPRELNGVEMTIGDLPLAQNVEDGRMQSVPDTYVGRIGLSYALWPSQGLSLSLGGRIEGIPVHDLVGGSDGYRGGGYAISIEPGLVWTKGRNTFAFSAPVAVERNRQRTVPNRRSGTHWGAAFADFLLQASYSRRF
ncbi:MAG: hypothetical protein HYY23_05445 [Verrucomicrobia bacterium]|nr:hypothetical protein [Verrucomicrobiota bacterium]